LKSVNDFALSKTNHNLITLVTCYDYWSAAIINETDIDAVLVGDSAAMVMHGFESTVNANIDMIAYHLAAVKRGIKGKPIIVDLPFLSHRRGKKDTIDVIEKLIKSGANAVKIEGADNNLEIIKYIIDSGIPVMGHLGFTPQSINSIGGYLVQGKDPDSASKLVQDARALQDIGCFSIVLELIPSKLSKEITRELEIPTIGIGAGPHTSGQIIVLQDLLGLSKNFNPKFLRKYLNGFDLFKDAINKYNHDVKSKLFPSEQESY
jgi:3-methyl-2-oxobutanoate hydroxymethyltransferase